jgi:tetratricopeptide (TPR) repeat protein
MKYVITLLVSLISLSSFAQQMSYQQWQEEAKTQINLQPEYGNVEKSKEQLETDQKFIVTELKELGTHGKASEEMVKLGFDYLYRGDLKTAMRRFNQAWLLDAKNENAYWGYGSVYFYLHNDQEALKQLEKGLSINPKSSNIITDIASINMSFYSEKNNPAYLDKAIELFKQSYGVDPSNQNTLFKLSAAYYYKKDCTNAWRFYNECMKLGGRQISVGYAEALKKQCKM